MNQSDQLRSLKLHLYDRCRQYVRQRVETARQAMEAAQEAANAESKSSAGDKYETGRAMAQLDRDRHAQLLAEALKLQRDLDQISPDKPCATVGPGALVQTSRGTFFISISAGKLLHNGTEYLAVSAASPIGSALAGRSAGDVVTFNAQPYRIEQVS